MVAQLLWGSAWCINAAKSYIKILDKQINIKKGQGTSNNRRN